MVVQLPGAFNNEYNDMEKDPSRFNDYKGEKIAEGGRLKELGDGYAVSAGGKAWFHGKEVDGVGASMVTAGEFHSAGGGYAMSGGSVYYQGQKLDTGSTNLRA